MAILNELLGNNWKTILGYFSCIFSILLNTTGISSVQALGHVVPSFQLYTLRYITQILLLLPQQLCEGFPLAVAKPETRWLLLASFLGTVLNITFVECSIIVALGIFKALESTSELVLLSLIAITIRKERNCCVYLAVLMCLCGSMLIVQPGNTTRKVHASCFGTNFNYSNPAISYTNQTHITWIYNSSLLNSSYTEYTHHINQTLKNNLHQHWNTTFNSTYDTLSNNYAINITPNQNENSTMTNALARIKRSPILGYCMSMICGLAFGAYFQTINSKLANVKVTVISFWTSLTGLIICGSISLCVDEIAWPASSKDNALLFGFLIPYGRCEVV